MSDSGSGGDADSDRLQLQWTEKGKPGGERERAADRAEL